MISVTGIEDARQQIREGHAITAAGVGGTIEVWRANVWCCRYSRFGCPVEYREFRLLTDVTYWLREWFPKCKLPDGRKNNRDGCAQRLSPAETRGRSVMFGRRRPE